MSLSKSFQLLANSRFFLLVSFLSIGVLVTANNLVGLRGISMQSGDIQVKNSGIGQFEDGLGVFANRNFKKGEVVIKWNLKTLTIEEFEKLPAYEKENFCHHRDGNIYFYPEPERHVNRSKNPNVIPDFIIGADIALRDIEKGEELSISDSFEEDFD